MLSAEELRKMGEKSPPIELITVDAWGGQQVAIQALGGLQMFEWDVTNFNCREDSRVLLDKGSPAERMLANSIVTCDVDADGNPVRGSGKLVFNAGKQSDLATIRNFGGALQQIYERCMEFNGLTKAREDKVRKNLPTAPGSDSGSSSQTDGAAV